MVATLVNILIALLIAGFVLWAVRAILDLVPMDAWLKQVANLLILIVVVAVVLVYVLIPLLHMLVGQIHL